METTETKTMTLAQAAAQVEGGWDVQIKIGNFDTFADFLTYFNAHYRPMLESMQQGQAPDQKLMGFFIDDMLSAFSKEEQTPSDSHSMGSGDSLSPLTEALQYVRENMDEDDMAILNAEVNKCYKLHLVPNSQLVDCSVVIDLMEEYGSEHDLPESWWEEYADIDEILNKLLEE